MDWPTRESAIAEPVAPLRRFLRNPLSAAGAAVVLVFAASAAVPGLLAPYPEDAGPSVHFDRTNLLGDALRDALDVWD